MKIEAIIIALAIPFGIVNASEQAAAKVLFLSAVSTVAASSSASAEGAAYAAGDRAHAGVLTDTLSRARALSVSAGMDSVSVGLGFATARFVGRAISFTATTKIETFESVNALAFDVESMASWFANPSLATFSFAGDAEARYRDIAFTQVSAPATTTGGSVWGPDNFVKGSAEAQASSDNSLDYTFALVGDLSGTVAVQYLTSAQADAPAVYDLELINDATQAVVGMQQLIDANADGEALWSLGSPGTYSLIIGERSSVIAADDIAAWSQGIFNMSIATMAVPELSTWWMMLTAFVGVGWVAWRHRLQ
jgi:hypothetical protein